MASCPKVILKEIVDLMICSSCKKYLSPPIWIRSNGENICDKCKNITTRAKKTTFTQNSLLQSIGSYLKFPCTYKKYGCKIVTLCTAAEIHEKECPFRQFSCPECFWSGTSANMKTHVDIIHSRLLLTHLVTRFSLVQRNGSYFIASMGEFYVLLYNCDIHSGLLWFSLKYVGSLNQAGRRHFKLTLLNNNNEYYERKQVKQAVNWKIEKDTAIKIDIYVLKMKLQLRHEKIIDLKIDVFSRQPLYNGSVDEDLLRDVECPVCLDYMYSPISQCVVGHSICNYCKPKLQSCPVCKGEMGTSRNYALESVCSKMYYKCMYADDGCTFSALPKDISEHENECDHGFFDCPFKSFIANCEWRGKLDQMSSHTLEEHGWKF